MECIVNIITEIYIHYILQLNKYILGVTLKYLIRFQATERKKQKHSNDKHGYT